VRLAGWICAPLLLSACLEPEALQFPPGATADARTVVWLVPDEAPIIQEVTAELRVPLHIRNAAHPRAMLYRCSPEELRVEMLLSEYGCLPPTQQQWVSSPGEPLLQPATDGSFIPACGPCELWPTTVKQELQLSDGALSSEVGVVLPDGQILITVHGEETSWLLRVDPWAGTVTTIEPRDGPEPQAFGPYWIDESGLYGMRARSIWRIELDGNNYRAQRLTEPHPGTSYTRAAALLRRGGEFDLATSYGGLLRTSASSTSSWTVVRANWESPQVEGLAARASMVELATKLVAVGVVWEEDHYQPMPEGPPRLFGYYHEKQGRDEWATLPSNQQVVSVVQEEGRAFVVSTFGTVCRLGSDRGPEAIWSPEQARNLRFATAGAGRIWAAPHGGSFFPIYPEHGVACEPTGVAFGSLLLANDTHLLHATGPNLTIAEVPPIVECGLPQE